MDRAWQLYQEMQEKGIPLTTEAYNALIHVVCFLREGNELRWQLIQVGSSPWEDNIMMDLKEIGAIVMS